MQAAPRPRSRPAKDGTARGRPSKFTPDRTKRILDAVRSGNYLETCAAYGGVSYQTLNEWIKIGEKLARGLPDEEPERQQAIEKLGVLDREYLDFSEAIREESAKAEMQLVMEIKAAAQGGKDRRGDWRANAFLVTHRFPDRWGRRVEQRELSGPKGGPIQVEDPQALTDADRLARLRRLMSAEATG